MVVPYIIGGATALATAFGPKILTFLGGAQILGWFGLGGGSGGPSFMGIAVIAAAVLLLAVVVTRG